MSQIPDCDKITPEEEAKLKRQYIRLFLLTMPLLGAISSIPNLTIGSENIANHLLWPVIIAMAFMWCTVDERAQERQLSFGWIFGLFILSPVVYPLYLFTKKGAKLGTVTLLKSIALILIGFVEFAFAASIIGAITGFSSFHAS